MKEEFIMLNENDECIRKWDIRAEWIGEIKYKKISRMHIARKNNQVQDYITEYIELLLDDISSKQFATLKRCDGSMFTINTNYIIDIEDFWMATAQLKMQSSMGNEKISTRHFLMKNKKNLRLERNRLYSIGSHFVGCSTEDMKKTETKKMIKNMVANIYDIYGLESPITDIQKAIEKLGGELEISDEHKYRSCCKKKGNSFVIGVSSAYDKRKVRFSIAQELGHLFLHMGYRTNKALWNTNEENTWDSKCGDLEKVLDENMFAYEFLMPEEEYRKVFESVNYSVIELPSMRI